MLLAQLQPRVCFFGHHHARLDAEVAGVCCIGLNKISMPGSLVAMDIEPGAGGKSWSLIAEYCRR